MHEVATNREEFNSRMLDFINNTLPQLDRRKRQWAEVRMETPLFASGLLDSLSILYLIACVEELSGKPVSDEFVLMKHFQSVATISATFGPAL